MYQETCPSVLPNVQFYVTDEDRRLIYTLIVRIFSYSRLFEPLRARNALFIHEQSHDSHLMSSRLIDALFLQMRKTGAYTSQFKIRLRTEKSLSSHRESIDGLS